MSDADIVRQGFEHHTGPPPGTEEALDRLVDRNEALQDEIDHLKRHHAQYHPGPCITQRSFEVDECPGCRSRTRNFRDKLWSKDRRVWIDCVNPWHDE